MIHSGQRWGFGYSPGGRGKRDCLVGKTGVGQGAAGDLGRGTTSGGSEQRDDITMVGQSCAKCRNSQSVFSQPPTAEIIINDNTSSAVRNMNPTCPGYAESEPSAHVKASRTARVRMT
jgi:hypothetical protein